LAIVIGYILESQGVLRRRPISGMLHLLKNMRLRIRNHEDGVGAEDVRG
jgi:hypothetical protein